jgi:hypothetical protein
LRGALKPRARYVLVANCALGVLLSRANRLLDPAITEGVGLKPRTDRVASPVPSLREQEGDDGLGAAEQRGADGEWVGCRCAALSKNKDRKPDKNVRHAKDTEQ